MASCTGAGLKETGLSPVISLQPPDDEQFGVPEPGQHGAALPVGREIDVLGGRAMVALGVDGAGPLPMPGVRVQRPHLDREGGPSAR